MKYLLFLLIVLASCNDGGADPEFVRLKENSIKVSSADRYFFVSYSYRSSTAHPEGAGEAWFECSGFPKRTEILRVACKGNEIKPEEISIVSILEFKSKSDYEGFSQK